MEQKIKIAVVDSYAMVRQAMTSLLRKEEDFSVIFEASNGRELLNQLKFKPVDIVILEHFMPIMDGLEALEVIKKRHTDVKVIMVTMCADNMTIAEYMTIGANSYVSKGSDISYLVNAIKTVNKDGYYFDCNTSKALLSGLIKDKTVKQLLDDVDFNDKELRVLKSICDGKTTKEISANCNMAISTVDLYRSRIYSKANALTLLCL
jgi:DNA-binding NarL/FixJ family response regulator